MNPIEWTRHAQEMLRERNISEEWVFRAIRDSDYDATGEDGNMHYIKAIPEHGGRLLRVIVNPGVFPNRIVTVFLIVASGGNNETQN